MIVEFISALADPMEKMLERQIDDVAENGFHQQTPVHLFLLLKGEAARVWKYWQHTNLPILYPLFIQYNVHQMTLNPMANAGRADAWFWRQRDVHQSVYSLKPQNRANGTIQIRKHPGSGSNR